VDDVADVEAVAGGAVLARVGAVLEVQAVGGHRRFHSGAGMVDVSPRA
jgi:hypothetical protein